MSNELETPTKKSPHNQTQTSIQSVSRCLMMPNNENSFSIKRYQVTDNKTLTLLEFNLKKQQKTTNLNLITIQKRSIPAK